MTTLDLLAVTTLKGSLLVVAAALVAVLWRRRPAALRHAMWTAAIAGALLLGPAALLLPSWRITPSEIVTAYRTLAPPRAAGSPMRLAAPSPGAPSAQVPARDEEPGHFSVDYVLYLWAAGAIGLASCFAVAALRLARSIRHAPVVTDPLLVDLTASIARDLGVNLERVSLRWSDQELTPLVWGIRHPVVLLPAVCREWETDRLREVLVHEIGHIQRWDILTQAIANAATAIYWFNPLIWIGAHRMLIERERACDDLVLSSGAKPSQYAHDLLEIARGMGSRWVTSHVGPAMARRSQISVRLLDVLDPHRQRGGAGRAVATAAALVCLSAALPLAALAPRTDGDTIQTLAVAAINPGAANVQAIAAANADFVAAVRRRDSKAIAEMYTTDGMMVTPSGPPTRGRQALRDVYDEAFENGMADAEIRTQEVYAVGDMILDIGRGTVLTEKGEVLSNTRSMTLWKKEEGKWRIHRDYTVRQ